jgi:ribosomal protein S15P/S13E
MPYIFFILVLTYAIFHNQHINSITPEPNGQESCAQNETALFQEIIKELNSNDLTSNATFSYLNTLLDHFSKAHKDHSDMRSAIKLFHNRSKRLEYTNAYKISEFLDRLPNNLRSYMTPQQYKGSLTFYDETTFDRFTGQVRSMLVTDFSTQFDLFKKDPELFVAKIAQKIARNAQEEIDIELLRSTVIRFLELSIGKLIWSPKDSEKTWDSVKHISKQLSNLVEANIINDLDDLDDLFWSLIHRYCYFLDLTGSILPNNFYAYIKNDINNSRLLLFTLEEQDEFIKPKIEYLKITLAKAEANTHKVREVK